MGQGGQTVDEETFIELKSITPSDEGDIVKASPYRPMLIPFSWLPHMKYLIENRKHQQIVYDDVATGDAAYPLRRVDLDRSNFVENQGSPPHHHDRDDDAKEDDSLPEDEAYPGESCTYTAC